MRALYMLYGVFGLCRRFGHLYGHKPFWALGGMAEPGGWYLSPSGKMMARFCHACAHPETKEKP